MKQQTIENTEHIIDAKISCVDKNYIYMLTTDLRLQKICRQSQHIVSSQQLPKQNLTDETKICFKLSPVDRFICVYNHKGQFGYVYDLEADEIVLALNRGDYHTEQTVFPLQFLYRDNEFLLIHCTDWNNIHVTNLTTKKLLTERVNSYQQEFYIDYFYGELHLSPSQQKIFSSGWVWSPVGVMLCIDIDRWLTSSLNEPEISPYSLQISSYYWDRAFCWLSDTEIVYLYDPREEDYVKEDFTDKFVGFECTEQTLKQSYLAFYNIDEEKHTKLIPFEYAKNSYFEGNAKLFYNRTNDTLICSSEEFGTRILSLDGEVSDTNPHLSIDNYCTEMNVSINVGHKVENNNVVIISFDKENHEIVH